MGQCQGDTWWLLIRKPAIHTGTSHYMKLMYAGRALLMHAKSQNKKNVELFIRFIFFQV